MKVPGLLLIVALLAGSCTPVDDKEIGLKVPTRHDDFLYSAQQVVIQDSIGPMKPRGRFWIIMFRVDNQAKRVEHPWTNQTAFATDSAGKVYENNAEAQQRLNRVQPFGWKDQYVTSAGHTDSTRLIFDLPTSVRQPYLQYRGEPLMGDAFDGRQFEHTRVRLF